MIGKNQTDRFTETVRVVFKSGGFYNNSSKVKKLIADM